MRWLCLLGLHRWRSLPMATPWVLLEAGQVQVRCDRCGQGGVMTL